MTIMADSISLGALCNQTFQFFSFLFVTRSYSWYTPSVAASHGKLIYDKNCVNISSIYCNVCHIGHLLTGSILILSPLLFGFLYIFRLGALVGDWTWTFSLTHATFKKNLTFVTNNIYVWICSQFWNNILFISF